jgi:hemoglobin/transferrin/lactoferrin receptor protein
VYGGETYREGIDSTRFSLNPVNRVLTEERAAYPNGSRYSTSGLFAQSTVYLARSLRTTVGGRFTSVRARTWADRNVSEAGEPLGVADSGRSFRDMTFSSSLSWQLTSALQLHGVVARGFRAPNMSDLGTVGLTGALFEVPAEEAAAAGGLLSSDSGDGALPLGPKMGALKPERLFSYEFGLGVRTRRAVTRVQFFDMELYDPVTGRTVLFPAGAVPPSLAGTPVTPLEQTPAQRTAGVTAVVTQYSPRAVRSNVNDGRSRYYGVETSAEYRLTTRWSAQGNWYYIIGREMNPNRPPRRLPPQQGFAAIRYVPPGRRPWFEVNVRTAGMQDRLNAGDLDDERIGASRRRADIASLFNTAARLSPWISQGVFTPTGETLQQIQNRVLPIGATINGVRVADDNTRVPLYVLTPGWTTVDVLGGMPVTERLRFTFGVQNLFDANYRIHGSGTDGAGFSIWTGVRFVF